VRTRRDFDLASDDDIRGATAAAVDRQQSAAEKLKIQPDELTAAQANAIASEDDVCGVEPDQPFTLPTPFAGEATLSAGGGTGARVRGWLTGRPGRRARQSGDRGGQGDARRLSASRRDAGAGLVQWVDPARHPRGRSLLCR
jgi:hypothetical protein